MGYELPPLPNLFFTRDAAMVVNEGVIIGAMKYAVRWTEELLMKALFTYHPLLGQRRARSTTAPRSTAATTPSRAATC